jgi:hypothetical protein
VESAGPPQKPGGSEALPIGQKRYRYLGYDTILVNSPGYGDSYDREAEAVFIVGAGKVTLYDGLPGPSSDPIGLEIHHFPLPIMPDLPPSRHLAKLPALPGRSMH